ncbi:MAG: histidine phosphatase family protein [Minisyncoccia bacterium]
MKIYFLRHGKTQLNKEKRTSGHLDVPLLSEGREEARKVFKLEQEKFDIIYSSDLIRCQETSEIINEKLKLQIIYDIRLRERDFGTLAGKLIDELGSELMEREKNQQYDYRPFGGESVEDVRVRVLTCIRSIIGNNKNKRVLVVTHGGVIRLLHNLVNSEVKENIINGFLYEFDFPDYNKN